MMNSIKTWTGTATLLAAAWALAACGTEPTSASALASASAEETVAAAAARGPAAPVPVSGSAIHFFTTSIVHSQEPTEGGMIERRTDIVRLSGDLDGYLVFHATSTFDFAAGTLVNTGTQLFSGTVLGSGPVLLHDDTFRFDVNLATGAVLGAVHLGRSNDAPHPGGWFECELEVVGTGEMTPEGDGMVDYSGHCTARGTLR